MRQAQYNQPWVGLGNTFCKFINIDIRKHQIENADSDQPANGPPYPFLPMLFTDMIIHFNIINMVRNMFRFKLENCLSILDVIKKEQKNIRLI